MGRTGKWWAIEHEGIVPDLLITAKGLSGGYAPISAVVGPESIVDVLTPAQQTFTYSGHGPSAAAALQTNSYIESQNLIKNATERGEGLLFGLEQICQPFPEVIKEVRGRGLMIGVEIDVTNASWRAKVFATRGMQLGAYFGFFGDANQVVRIEPPLIITTTEVGIILETVERVAHEMKHDQLPSIVFENTLKYAIGL